MRALQPSKAPVCGVFAATLATDLAFDDVMAKARKIKKNPGAWKGRLYLTELRALLNDVGVQFSEPEGFRKMTLASAAKELDQDRQYIVFVTGHYLTLHHGLAYDQYHVAGASIEEYKFKRRRIRAVLKLH